MATHVHPYTKKDGTYVSGYDRGDSRGFDISFSVMLFLMIVAAVIILVFVDVIRKSFDVIRKSLDKRASAGTVPQNAVAAVCLLKSIQNGTFTPPNTPVLLREDEVAILNESCELMEAKGTRLYGGAGTRIKGIYVGGGASRSFDSLSGIDSGTLTLTNQRIVFAGSMQSRLAELKQIVSLKGFSDAIEIASGKNSKSQVYVVNNPILWEGAIKLIISGGFQVQQLENRKPLATWKNNLTNSNPFMPTIEDVPIENVPHIPKMPYPHRVGSDVHFECQYCRQPIEVNSEAAGDEFQCPECGKKLVVPYVGKPAQHQSTALDTSFLMTIADAFNIQGCDVAVTGVIEQGIVRIGDNIFLKSRGTVKKVEVCKIEQYRKQLIEAKQGDSVGLELRGATKADVLAGDLLAGSEE